MKEKMYIVRYSSGSYEDYDITDIFVTNKKSNATKYCTKFNRMLERWNKHYEQYEDKKYGGLRWIKDEHAKQHFRRWHMLSNINRCHWEEVEVR
jgi:hypothetical protein